jgi:hypothetical protein
MSQINENEILGRLKRLSQVEPPKESADRAMQKVRDALIAGEGRRVGLAPPSFIGRLIKLAAAAVLMIGAGFIGGRLSAPEPVNVQELQAALESSLKSSLVPAIQQELLSQVDDRWQSTLAASNTKVKDELARQVRSDLELFADRTLTTIGSLTDQRLMEFARIIEAARIKERQRVAAAFDYMGARFGDGLVTLAARTDNLLETERAGSTPDISEN